jgi:hypothetical protein
MQQWRWATESTVLDKVALGIFLAAMIALVGLYSHAETNKRP